VADIITAWATVALAILTVGMFVVYLCTLWALQDSVKETRRSVDAATKSARIAQQALESQNVLDLLQFLGTDKVREARGVLYSLQKDKVAFESWDRKQRDSVAMVCSTFNSAAIFLDHMSPADRTLMYQIWGSTITRCYDASWKLIEDRRKTDHERFWEQFEQLNGAIPPEYTWKETGEGQ
jgi:hypothetical protein